MNGQEEEIKARNNEADRYEDWYLQRGYYYDWVEKTTILNALNLKREDIVLDVGCGTGRFTREIAKRCKKVYGVDFSPESIEVLNKKAKQEGIENIESYICDITKQLPIKEAVDKVLSVQVIQHIPTEAERCLVMNNLYNQLNDGGVCVISLYNWGFASKGGLLKEGRFSNGIYYNRFTSNEIEALFEKCGFKNISVRGCINLKGYNILSGHKIIYKLLYIVAKIDTFLSRFGFSCSYGDFIVCKGIK